MVSQSQITALSPIFGKPDIGGGGGGGGERMGDAYLGTFWRSQNFKEIPSFERSF